VLHEQTEVQPLSVAHAGRGTLPHGYTVKKRKLVKTKGAPVPALAAKAGKKSKKGKKIKKGRLPEAA
jgi:hypothetical protein